MYPTNFIHEKILPHLKSYCAVVGVVFTKHWFIAERKTYRCHRQQQMLHVSKNRLVIIYNARYVAEMVFNKYNCFKIM